MLKYRGSFSIRFFIAATVCSAKRSGFADDPDSDFRIIPDKPGGIIYGDTFTFRVLSRRLNMQLL